jgi:Lrp/AsnC family transcriptional regulator for asnA, asnC and gidA
MAEPKSRTRGGRRYAAAGKKGDATGDLRGGLPKSPILASPMDTLNQAIVGLLEQDGRLAFKEIAEKLEVSEGTVRNRVNWMKRSGMLRIVAIADPTAFRYKADAMIGLKVAASSSPKKLAERLARHAEVVYILWVAGRFDLLIEVVTESEERFLDFLERHCYDNADIAQIEVMTGLAMYKNQFLLKRDIL